MNSVDPRLLKILECPRCHSELELAANRLFCHSGHHYPIADGIPVFILPEREQTIGVAMASYNAAANGTGGPIYVDTLGLSDVEKASIELDWVQRGSINRIDPAISYLVGATSGCGYVKLIGRLKRYPIPKIPLTTGFGKLLLDVGCNWGRWSISGVRKGWNVIGIDPSLGAIMAARRAFQNERNAMFVCGDARFLPFKDHSFDCVFSYSVVQHFSEVDAEKALAEIGRVLSENGFSKIQMAHRGGLRSTYIRTRPNYSNEEMFSVRYWSLNQMKCMFDEKNWSINHNP
jgi:SAM-dependent methyltransferase